MSKTLVVGSVGYDFVFDIHGKIKDKISILDNQVNALDLLFTSKNLTKRFGGTAGNIAYGLALLSSPTKIFSVAGKDYLADYKPRFDELGIHDNLVILDDNYTATYYAASDEEKNLIGIWQPNAHENIHKHNLKDNVKELKNVKYAIFSPGTDKSISKHIEEVSTIAPNATTIFDPGQITNFFDPKLMENSIKHAKIIVGNEVEIPLIEKMMNTTVEELAKNAIVVKTLGEKGTEIYEGNKKYFVEPQKIKKAVEATGAGDAFRSGLLFGLSNGLDIINSAKIGNLMGALNVQTPGGQMYKVSKKDKEYINSILKNSVK